MVSMASLHFFRWTEQLNDSGHEVYWFDILDSGKPSDRVSWVHQMVGWKLRWDFPGRYFVKNKFPRIYKFIQKVNNRNTAHEFEKYLLEVKPEVVHSFALYISCSPILRVMSKYPKIKWIYSSWGSDLFYFKNIPEYLSDIKKVLPRINYLFTDCNRDYKIAQELGFSGQFLGVFPGGGGYKLKEYENYLNPLEERKIILIKGFQGRSGRAIQVLKAVLLLKKELESYNVIVFGADKEVIDFSNQTKFTNWNNFKIVPRIAHLEVMQFMGKSLIYIGNSNSDGMPNTLLEAIIMGAFPIQSNPESVTEEIIEEDSNGLLIYNHEDELEIKAKIEKVLNNKGMLLKSFNINMKLRHQLDYDYIREQVLGKYTLIENSISN